MGIKRYELSEAQWRRIEAMLPGKASDPGRTAADIQIDGLGIRLEPPRMWLDPNEPLRKQLNERIRQAALMELDSRAEPLDRIPPSERAVASAVAVPALPEIEPAIVLEKVLIPATVWSPESPTKAPGPPMAMTEVAVPPAPPVPVP